MRVEGFRVQAVGFAPKASLLEEKRPSEPLSLVTLEGLAPRPRGNGSGYSLEVMVQEIVGVSVPVGPPMQFVLTCNIEASMKYFRCQAMK